MYCQKSEQDWQTPGKSLHKLKRHLVTHFCYLEESRVLDFLRHSLHSDVF